ncbi:hypothetical protein K461DRAFT_298019 [Myriangium duriaei CBS 260.36]|uniref:Uncharacterized protein n=1 Tax=Myriangium duriaei CBS 260.36 TaxID=1168546 RepID=A0A9P4IVH4_9PEZI|nr:hypothetical protein K461DRAFT_298019 [Myriangium duriaei CBS 260.36]
MFSTKIFLLAILAFAASVFAVDITFSGKHESNNPVKPPVTGYRKSYLDLDANDIIKNMGAWSGGRFEAKASRRPGSLTIQNVNKAANEASALSEVEEMRKLVTSNAKKVNKSGSSSPRHAGSRS